MKTIKSNQVWAIVIGAGMVIFPVHNQWLTKLTTSEGEVSFFLPAFGAALWIMGSLGFIVNNWSELDWGDKKVFIPLLIIVGSIGLSGLSAEAWNDKLAPLLAGISLFAVYLASRKLGKDILKPLTIGVVIASVGIIAYGILNPGERTGGFVFDRNYDVATGVLVLGTLVSIWQRQWILTAVAIVGLFFTGAEEGLFAIGVLVVVIVARRDWSWKLLAPVGALTITLVICTPLGITQDLYLPAAQKIASAKEAGEGTVVVDTLDKIIPEGMQAPVVGLLDRVAPATSAEESRDELLDRATNTRWLTHWKLSPIKPFGYGYNMTGFYEGIPHNIVLIIIEQVGVVAAVAWCFVTGWCLFRTKWKYAFIAVLALGVFDHYLWTQVAPWWWCLVGVSTASDIKSDLIFKEVKNA